MRNERVEVMVGEPRPVEMNFELRRWFAEPSFAEGDFPLIATVHGKRYELFSEGTFAEEER